MTQKINLLLAAVIVTLLASCGGSEDDPKPQLSDAKSITSFVFSNLTPALPATIDEDQLTISVTVPNGLDLTALVPTISISEKATVHPASGVKVNLNNDLSYTVIAEDGTQQQYTVNVTVSETVSFTVNPLSSRYIEQDEFLVLEGTNFINHSNNKIVLTKLGGGTTIIEVPLEYLSATSMRAKIPADAVLGQYDLRVYNGYETVKVGGFDFYSIAPHRPVITSVSKLNVNIREQIVVEGNYFNNIDYSVYMVNGDFSTRLELQSYTKTSMTFKVPVIIYNSYQLIIENFLGDAIYAEPIKIIPAADAPTIQSVNKLTFAKGETLVITGTNLKKSGLATYVVLTQGNTAMTGAATTVSADGTQVTYTLNFAGTYKVQVECGVYGGAYDESGFTFSGYYTSPITVNP